MIPSVGDSDNETVDEAAIRSPPPAARSESSSRHFGPIRSASPADREPDDSAQCMRCWPTNHQCLLFYSQLVLSLILVVVSLVMLMLPDTDNCFFQSLLTGVVMWWLPKASFPKSQFAVSSSATASASR